MSDDMTPTPANQPPTPPKEADFARELREMGVQFEAMFRAALESERAQQLRRDLAGGVQELSNQIQMTLKTLQSNATVQQAEERGREFLAQAQQSKLVQEVQETVVTGVAQINERLRLLVAQIDQQSGTPPPTLTSTQQVPIETEAAATEAEPAPAPATGETRRLDDES